MRPNHLREKWASGEPAIGCWLTMPSSVSAEAIAAMDFDYVCVDMQHGLVDYSDSVHLLQAITTGSPTPMVRVAQNTFAHIGKALDAGAMGVIVPMVNTVEDARAAIHAARYTPDGGRSFGPTRTGAVEGPDYWDRANQDVACIPMIETVQAVESLEDILAIDSVDAIYVGPGDLSASMGFHPRSNETAFLEMLDRIVAACHEHNVVPGIHTTPATAPDRLERGFRMITITSDLNALRAKVSQDLDEIRRLAKR